MLNRPCRSSHTALIPLTVILGSLALVGCSDKIQDDAYGFIDLAPYYYDGSSAAAPSAGLVREIAPIRGWMSGIRAEYYDFGLVGFTRKRTDGTVPDYASVLPMYFFFDTAGNPLFSKPKFEKRTGQWWMKGGPNTLDPNPVDDATLSVPYSVRVRAPYLDERRGSADYQRPIVDRLQHNTDYSGLWEIWEVTAPDDYPLDSIKQYSTLQTALATGGQWSLHRTQKVINCPVIDDRQSVTVTPLWYGIPHPRIELWYRTKQGSCFLADGWLALGTMRGDLIAANNDDQRLNMFDVISYTIGEGDIARTTVTAPVSLMYTPKVIVASQDPTRGATEIRFVGDNVTNAPARMKASDPPGYSPLRWLWDLRVPQDPPYQPGSYKRLEQMDPSNLSKRLLNPLGPPYVKNFPLIGTVQRCANDGDCAAVPAAPGLEGKLQCNLTPTDIRFPTGGLAVNDVPPGSTVASLIEAQEGGPRCDVPAVAFAEFCAPGVARCKLDAGTGTPDQKPTIEGKVLTTNMLGYTCQPMGTGYCYFRCDSDAGTATTAGAPKAIDINYNGPGGTMKTDKGSLVYENRCGNMPGYRCMNPSPTTPAVPTRLRVCLRSCDPAKPDPYTDLYCTSPAALKIDGRFDSPNVQTGMHCSNRGIDNAAACQWDPAFEPRDPNSNFLPGR
jgi:hypothetical protein